MLPVFHVLVTVFAVIGIVATAAIVAYAALAIAVERGWVGPL